MKKDKFKYRNMFILYDKNNMNTYTMNMNPEYVDGTVLIQ
jgi:hypothetical protein